MDIICELPKELVDLAKKGGMYSIKLDDGRIVGIVHPRVVKINRLALIYYWYLNLETTYPAYHNFEYKLKIVEIDHEEKECVGELIDKLNA